MSVLKSGRIQAVSDDGRGAVVRDNEGHEYAVTNPSDAPAGDLVLFEVEDLEVGTAKVRVAKIV